MHCILPQFLSLWTLASQLIAMFIGRCWFVQKICLFFLGSFLSGVRTDQQLLFFGWVGRRFHNTTQRNQELSSLHWWKKKCWFMFLTGRGVGVGMRTRWKVCFKKDWYRTWSRLWESSDNNSFTLSVQLKAKRKDKGLNLWSLEAKMRVTFWSD